MPYLPDELWVKILDLGVKNSKFTYKDLCSISISCKRLYQLSGEDSLWSQLYFSNFPGLMSHIEYSYSSSSLSAKSKYQIRSERRREFEPTIEALRSGLLDSQRVITYLKAQRRAVLEQENMIREIKLVKNNIKRRLAVARQLQLT